MANPRLIRLLASLAFVMLTACQTTKTIPALKAMGEGELDRGAIVFGKVEVVEGAEPLEWEGVSCAEKLIFHCPDVFRVLVVREGTEEPIQHMLEGDGSFFWVLPAGEFLVAEWVYEDWDQVLEKTYSGRVGARFVVPPRQPAVYIGTLAIIRSDGGYTVGVIDDYDEAVAALRQRSTRAQPAPPKSLLRLPPEQAVSRVSDVCGPAWGVQCTGESRGVVPVDPPTRKHGFAEVEGLQPTLRWTPSSRSDVTYDVIVYEAVPYKRSGTTQYIQGPVVVYAEGVREPEFTIQSGLEPDHRYFWSVRLRSGETVSQWSSRSYDSFYFLIVVYGWEEGSGLPFTFRTP